jgi:hypothetical protein
MFSGYVQGTDACRGIHFAGWYKQLVILRCPTKKVESIYRRKAGYARWWAVIVEG